MKDSATNITLGIGCVVTALTLSTTCFLTVNTVLAYVGGDQPGSSRDKADAEPIVAAALPSRKLAAAAALPETVGAVAKPEVSDSGRRVSTVIPPSAAYIPEPRRETALPAESVIVSTADSTPSVATADLPPRRQEQSRVADVETIAEVSTVVLTNGELQRCVEGSFAGAICREAMRWNSCHPDGWNKTPECVVQQFEVFMQ